MGESCMRPTLLVQWHDIVLKALSVRIQENVGLNFKLQASSLGLFPLASGVKKFGSSCKNFCPIAVSQVLNTCSTYEKKMSGGREIEETMYVHPQVSSGCRAQCQWLCNCHTRWNGRAPVCTWWGDLETCPSVAEMVSVYIQVYNVEGTSAPFSVVIFRPFSPPEWTVWRVTRKITLNALCNHFRRAEEFSVLVLKLVESIGSGGRKSIAPVAQASWNLQDSVVSVCDKKLVKIIKLTRPHHTSPSATTNLPWSKTTSTFKFFCTCSWFSPVQESVWRWPLKNVNKIKAYRAEQTVGNWLELPVPVCPEPFLKFFQNWSFCRVDVCLKLLKSKRK